MAGTHVVDSHCHLDGFAVEDFDAILDRAVAAGVSGIVTIGTRLSATDSVIEVVRRARARVGTWCTIGTHPDHADDDCSLTPGEIATRAQGPEIIGIGETGLDYVRGNADRPRQKDSFRCHIEAARLAGLPLIVHARGADDDMAAILTEEQGNGAFDFVLHCFSSGAALARVAVELGGFVSFSGILTFPKSAELRAIARTIPHERLLLETDAPYLAPVPKRGQQNEPAFVIHTASVLAELLNRSTDDVARLTVGNFRRLFTKAH